MQIEDHEDIKEGMRLRCISENYEGTVKMLNGVLQTDCCGFGDEPICNLDLNDIEVINIPT